MKTTEPNKWVIIEEKFKNRTIFSVSDGEVGERTFSYDFETKKEAENKLEQLNKTL